MHNLRSALIALGLLVGVFPAARAPQAVLAVDDIAQLRSDSEELLTSRAESLWRRWISGEILAGVTVKSELGTATSLAKIDGALQQAHDPVQVRRLQRLRSFLADEALSEADGALSTEIADLVASATVSLESRDVPFRTLEATLESEPDAATRKKIWATALQELERLNPLLTDREALREKTARSLGFAKLLDFEAALRDAPLDSLSVLADEFLANTGDLNRHALESLAPTLNIPVGDLGPADLPRLYRTQSFDAAFPAPNAVVVFRTVARSLGTDLAGLTFDLEQRRAKVAAPLCLPVRPPADVRCSLFPLAGIGGTSAILREGVQGIRLSQNRSPDFEFRWLGGTAVAEAYGQLFDRLSEKPDFLVDAGVAAPPAAAFSRTRAARRLHEAREAAGRFLVEKARLGGLASDPARVFQETLTRADGVTLTAPDAQRHLLETTDLLASADDFRAALLAAQLDATLVKGFGPAWWKSPAAGAYLRGLWASGTQETPDELAKKLGAPDLNADAFTKSATEALSH
jgi:hypothetical protein